MNRYPVQIKSFNYCPRIAATVLFITITLQSNQRNSNKLVHCLGDLKSMKIRIADVFTPGIGHCPDRLLVTLFIISGMTPARRLCVISIPF